MKLSLRASVVAVGVCVAMVSMANDAAPAEVVRASQSRPTEQRVPTNKEELDAVEVARTALARALYVPADTLPVLSIEKRTWSNSGLGCASLDTATINLPRRGYAVALATPDGARNVHVSGRQSRICHPQPKNAVEAGVAEAINSPPPSYDLNAMVERSREDLARQLSAPVNSVRLVSFASTTWPDNTMDCVVPYEQTRKRLVKGYRIQLRHGERQYIYHTDMVRTRACPPIDPPKSTSASAQNAEPSAVKPAKTTKPGKQPMRDKRTTAKAASTNYVGVMPRNPSP